MATIIWCAILALFAYWLYVVNLLDEVRNVAIVSKHIPHEGVAVIIVLVEFLSVAFYYQLQLFLNSWYENIETMVWVMSLFTIKAEVGTIVL